MNSPSVAPDCLVAPEPIVRIVEDVRPMMPTQAGYVLRPNREYQLAVTVQGVPADAFRVKVRQWPAYVTSSHSADDPGDCTRAVSLHTNGIAPLSLWGGFGDDLVLTITFDDPDLETRHVKVPIAPSRPWWSGTLFLLPVIGSWAWWCLVDRPAWLSADWAYWLLLATVVLATFVFFGLFLHRRFRLPWCRYGELRRRAAERLLAPEAH